MKRNKTMKGTRKMTPLQLALAELKTAKHVGSEAATLEDWVKDYLIPQLNATKKKVIVYKGKVMGVQEVPDHRARLKALHAAFQLRGAFAPEVHKPPR